MSVWSNEDWDFLWWWKDLLQKNFCNSINFRIIVNERFLNDISIKGGPKGTKCYENINEEKTSFRNEINTWL